MIDNRGGWNSWKYILVINLKQKVHLKENYFPYSIESHILLKQKRKNMKLAIRLWFCSNVYIRINKWVLISKSEENYL